MLRKTSTRCSRIQELPTSIGQLSAFQNLHWSMSLSLKILLKFIGQLSAFQNLHWSMSLSLKILLKFIGQWNVFQNFDLLKCLACKNYPHLLAN